MKYLFNLSRMLIVGLNEVFLQMCFLFLLLSSNLFEISHYVRHDSILGVLGE